MKRSTRSFVHKVLRSRKRLYLFLFSILKSTSLIFFRSNQSSLIQVSLQSIHESDSKDSDGVARVTCDKMYSVVNKDKPYEEPEYSVDEEDFVKVHGSDFVSLLCQNLFMTKIARPLA
ncbi:hypothetical protein HanIR_Chr11g0520121 [Helianthus annuus]|nr:hypothetical protein HanIR_Chr11g0520121 [Helianthus annuus]